MLIIKGLSNIHQASEPPASCHCVLCHSACPPGACAVNRSPARFGHPRLNLPLKTRGSQRAPPARMPARGAKKRVDFELPARKACAVRHEGCFGGLKQGSQLLRPGENIFVQAAWSSGDSGNFDFGQGFARLARVHGKKGDNYGDYRPDVGHDP